MAKYDFGPARVDFSTIGNLGQAFFEPYDKAKKQNALDALGRDVETGHYRAAAAKAAQAGNPELVKALIGFEEKRREFAQKRFDQIAGTVAPVLQQGLDPIGDATHSYAQNAQAALGRPAPRSDDGTGTDLGNHRFFTHRYGAAGTTPAPSDAAIIAQAGVEGQPVHAAHGGQRFLANAPSAAGRFTAPPAQVAPSPAQTGAPHENVTPRAEAPAGFAMPGTTPDEAGKSAESADQRVGEMMATASRQSMRLSRIEALARSVEAGRLQPNRINVAALGKMVGLNDKILEGIGLDPKAVGSPQALNAIYGRMLADMIGSRGIPAGTLEALASDSRANSVLAEMAKRTAQIDIEKAKGWREWKRANPKGSFDDYELEFGDRLSATDRFADLAKKAEAFGTNSSASQRGSKPQGPAPVQAQPQQPLPRAGSLVPATRKEVDDLRANPSLAAEFDDRYGAGAAAKFLPPAARPAPQQPAQSQQLQPSVPLRTSVNPKTGERRIWDGNDWVPFT